VSERRKIRTIIVDDEELARQVLRELIGAHTEIEIVAECTNGFEAVKAITESKPDLLFLDIQMPKLDGFEVLELTGTDTAIVFTTAYDEYALKAFEVHAVDYLLKPFGAERFEKALQHVRERIDRPAAPVAQLAQAARAPGEHLDRVVVRDGTRVHIIPITKLDYIEAQDDYVALASEGHKYLKQQTIASMEGALDPKCFLRVHRSYIVNLERVAKIEPYGKDSRVAILADDTRLPVSRAGHERLRSVLEQR
jgi:two-component system, LytTR family, response regulator